MKYLYLILSILMVTCFFSQEASARFFVPKCQPGSSSSGADCQEPLNQSVDIDQSVDIRDMTYSATWDASLDPRNIQLTSIPVCLYDRTQNPPQLIVNSFLTTDKAKILFGISKPNSCPLPGSTVVSNYPNAIAGEFLISGVICVVNSIIFNSMFKIYCTILLWFYNIVFSMIIIYVMFYGLFIMLGIGNDPIKEAPKRILKVIIIFGFAANAQIGFRYVHNGFLTILSSYSDMLVDLQPYTDDSGQPAYKKGTLAQIASATGLDLLVNQGPLLDENGDEWKTLPPNTEYYDMFYYNYRKAINQPLLLTDAKVHKQTPSVLNYTYNIDTAASPEDYVPFRIPDMQWTYKENPKGTGDYTLYPVFQDVTEGAAVNWGNLERDGWQGFRCILDFKWNAYPVDEAGKPIPNLPGRLELYPRCQKSLWPTLPNVVPFGQYCDFYVNNALLGGKVVPDEANAGQGDYCVNANLSGPTGNRILTHPPRLREPTYTGNNINPTSLNAVCSELTWWECRKPFQGILSRIDSMFSSVFGSDSSKNLGALIIAIALWSTGSGILLSLFMTMGLMAMLAATMQLIWTYVTAIMSLTFLLMLSPIFISCALFKITENMFKGWLASCISFALQPFLVLAFIFMLSHMTTLDRLAKLAKTEITNKIYIVNGKQGETKITFKAPSFKMPLYEKPSDFDDWYYKNYTQNSSSSSSSGSPVPAPVFITSEQRDKYLWNKGEYILSYWLEKAAGTAIDQLHVQSSANLLPSNRPDLINLLAIWYEGKWEYQQKTARRGIQAVGDYSWYYDPANIPSGQTVNPNANTIERDRYKDLVNCWSFGCSLVDGSGVPTTCPQTNCDTYEGIDSTGNGASVDDWDSFVGEPVSTESWGSRAPEFPVCIKNCPQFRPAYNPADPSKSNPSMNAIKNYYPVANPQPDLVNNLTGATGADGIPDNAKACPDLINNTTWASTPDGIPDICAPNTECIKYCMFIPEGKKDNYGYLMTGILVWVILNILTAAFMGKVPALAEALSRWDLSTQGIIVGGASRKYDETGMDEWTKAEQSQMYNPGGLFDTGIISGNAGAIPALLDKTIRTAAGPKERVDQQGRIVRDDYGVPYWRKDPDAQAARKQQKAMENKVAIYREIKSKMGLKENESMNTGKQFEIGGSGAEQGRDYNNQFIMQFSTLRPPNKTGLPHRKIQEVIERVLGTHKGASVDQLKEYIKREVDDVIRDMMKENTSKN